ncbi:hypothetical protein FGO68_gene6100 [Halteria grandinella]|uniref:Uncharacterized protein n=1 Tax=Halteria grandinella TaxID=5974 RepID=A0A8J8NHF3_HALGN|nr:hypothetical protein FGO68_gene6100 [Halteria grandinella]
MRNQGLIIAFQNNFNQSYLSIENNTFSNIYQAYQVFNTNSSYIQQYVQNIFGYQYIHEEPTDPYLQISHLITVMNVTATLVIINDNTFRNISIIGPLINLSETPGFYTTTFIIANNHFSTIQSIVNSNILQITRSKIRYDADYEVPPNVDMKPGYQYLELRYQLLAGSIVIIGNTFIDICGGENVDASIMLIGVRHNMFDDYANMRWHFPVIDKEYFTNKFGYSYYLLESLYFEDVSITHHQIGEIHLIRMGVNISGNIYQNICMGPEIYDKKKSDSQWNYFKARGSLASFIFISQVQMYNETFINIGSYSQNQTDKLQMKIKNINSLQPRYKWGDPTKLNDITDYINNTLSTSLLVVQYGEQIIISGCTFDNIWLIDRLNALSRSQAQGLILYVEIFQGQVTLGQQDKPMVLQNLNGFLNDKNIDLMRENYGLDPKQDYFERFAQYGVGSILFNLHNSSNSYSLILMENVVIRDSFFCANKISNYKKAVRAPAIMSTFLGDDSYQKFPQIVIIKNITITDVNFDGISNYFEILGKFVNINNIIIKRIGLKDFPASSPFIIDFIGSDRVSRDPELSSSFIKIFLFSAYKSYEQQSTDISNLNVSNINPSSGAFPIFSFDMGQNLAPEQISFVPMDTIEILDSLLIDDKSYDEQLLAKGSLFKVETAGQVNLVISISELSMSKVFTQCKFFSKINPLNRWSI